MPNAARSALTASVPAVPAQEPDGGRLDAALAYHRIRHASTVDERAETLAEMLADWYATWPPHAVTDPHSTIAAEIVQLLVGH